jgi:hypothetical protein
MCNAFPWVDPETGGRYEYDVTICGMFEASPELVEIQRALPPARSEAELAREIQSVPGDV